MAGICVTISGSTAAPATCTSDAPTRPSALPLTIPERPSSARTADLACLLVGRSGSGLVLVASLSPKQCQFLPQETSSQGQLILAGSLLLASVWFSIMPVSHLSQKSRTSQTVPRSRGHLGLCSCRLSSYPSLKGVLNLVTFPVADGARLLGIHPKTLHRWLTQSNFPVATHPRDARLKCLTLEQLQHLAQIHGRPVPSPATTPPSATREQDSHLPEHEGEPLPIACEVPPPLPHEADLIHKLSCLETRVATLSEQLAHLALLLLHERERTVESRLSQLETTLQALAGKPAPSPALADQEVTVSDNQPPPVPKPARPLHPMEPLVRSRMPPSIEYGAQGTYVIVSSQDGEVHVEPDSPPWFEWLATLSSFRFLSPQGRFTAYRDTSLGQQTCSWVAYRRIHGRSYRHGLGVTDRLTITHLEQMAAKLQSYLE